MLSSTCLLRLRSILPSFSPSTITFLRKPLHHQLKPLKFPTKMTSEHHHHRIQALDGTNYSTWSDEMKAYLCSKGL